MFTPRQRAVCRIFLSSGAPDTEIAKQLGISVLTAQQHIRNIRDRVNMGSKWELCWVLMRRDDLLYEIFGVPTPVEMEVE